MSLSVSLEMYIFPLVCKIPELLGLKWMLEDTSFGRYDTQNSYLLSDRLQILKFIIFINN